MDAISAVEGQSQPLRLGGDLDAQAYLYIGITLTLALLPIIAYHVFVKPHLDGPVAFNVTPPDAFLPENFDELEILAEPAIAVPGSTVIQCYAPASGKLLGRVNPVTAEGVDRAVVKAREAQLKWARTQFADRRKVLRSLQRHILDNQDIIARAACLDSGKPRVDASFGEILVTAHKLAWTIKHGEDALKADKRSTNLLMAYKKNEVRYEPLGVIAACVSWNYPFHNLLNPIISSLFTGNALIIKPSERTALSSAYFTRIVQTCLSTLGHDPHLVQCLPCWPNVANHLTSHPGIQHITFIGSRAVAQHVAASAAKALTPLTLELGGKDPALILDDLPASDVKRVASILMRGVFQAAGQNCIGIERVIAQPRVLSLLLPVLEQRVKALRVGDALATPDTVDVGACISPDNFGRLERLIQDAVKQGAKLHCGGSRYAHPELPQGHYFQPTLLSNITPSMAIAQDELFAPIMLLFAPSATGTITDVISTANSTPYALGASVFGKHGSVAVEVAVKGVRAGMVSVNDFASYYLCGLPFGGGQGKGSGYGRFGGIEGLRSLCSLKSVNRDGYGGWAKTAIPPRLDAGAGVVGGEAKKWAFSKGIVGTGYGLGWGETVSGVMDIIANS